MVRWHNNISIIQSQTRLHGVKDWQFKYSCVVRFILRYFIGIPIFYITLLSTLIAYKCINNHNIIVIYTGLYLGGSTGRHMLGGGMPQGRKNILAKLILKM